jgi:hypothetical protein
MRGRLTPNQKSKHVVAGLVLSLVSSSAIGVALAILTHSWWVVPIFIGMFIYIATIYFSEGR